MDGCPLFIFTVPINMRLKPEGSAQVFRQVVISEIRNQ